jgi:flagellar biosynthetic protein FliR
VLNLIPDVAGEQILAFVLVLSRLGGLFLFAPGFSSKLVPVRAKLLVAGAIAIAFTPLASRGQTIPSDPIELTTLIVKEVSVGLAIALAIGVIAVAVQAGASLLDTISGFSFANLVDPFTNMQATPLSQIYGLVATMVFLLTGGDHLAIQGIARSYELVPLDAAPSTAVMAGMAVHGLTQIFIIGLEVAAPVLIALVLTDTALGIVSRAAPQVNVMFVGMPAKILVAFTVAAASLPFVVMRVDTAITDAIFNSLAALK